MAALRRCSAAVLRYRRMRIPHQAPGSPAPRSTLTAAAEGAGEQVYSFLASAGRQLGPLPAFLGKHHGDGPACQERSSCVAGRAAARALHTGGAQLQGPAKWRQSCASDCPASCWPASRRPALPCRRLCAVLCAGPDQGRAGCCVRQRPRGGRHHRRRLRRQAPPAPGQPRRGGGCCVPEARPAAGGSLLHRDRGGLLQGTRQGRVPRLQGAGGPPPLLPPSLLLPALLLLPLLLLLPVQAPGALRPPGVAAG